MADRLTMAVSELLVRANDAARTPQAAEALREARERMNGPLRLAIAGKVKSGKSTLLNALLGEELAPTNAGECTRVVTWYRWDEQRQVRVHPRHGRPEPCSYDRSGGALEIDLGLHTAEDVDHLEITWPTRRLRDLTIIDTPGLASMSTDLSAETYRVIAPDEDRPSAADAVLYLLRHTHASDIRFLESFHDDELAHGTPMNAVGVLSRADEIGSCRLDALDVAARIADRYQADPRLRRLCPLVVPVAGLLGQAGETLTEGEYRPLRVLAFDAPDEADTLLLTADRFLQQHSQVPVTQLERQHLLQRLGLFGVRLSMQLLRSGAAPDCISLGTELAHRSGLARLREVLLSQFTDRSRVLKARSALIALGKVLTDGGCNNGEDLQASAEQIMASAHAFVEIRLLNQLRGGALDLGVEQAAELDLLLGGAGHDASSRLGLTGEPDDVLYAAALSALEKWHHVAEHPLSGRALERAARIAIRSLEGVIADATGGR